jgi:hypothetical protein
MASENRVKRVPCRRQETIKKAIAMAVVLVSLGLLTAPVTAAQDLGQSQGTLPQNPLNSRFPDNTPHFPKPTRKQKKAIMDSNFKKLKEHAKALAELSKSLQEDIEKSNENVLSLEIVKKAEQAEKLARQIRDEAKGD